MCWLFNRDKTIAQLEHIYEGTIEDDARDAVFAAFAVEPLDPEERETLAALTDGADPHLGAKLIELLDVGVRRETLDERLTEQADSAVIYTADVALMLLLTSNEGAYEDETGEEAPTDEARAAFAYVADAHELLTNEYAMADFARALLNPK